MQDPAITPNTDNRYFEVKPHSVGNPHVEVALTVLVSQFPGIVAGMVRQVSIREYAVRLYVLNERGSAMEETWVRVKDVPYERDGAHFGQCVGNPPVLWATLVERALRQRDLQGDLRTVLQALTGRASFETISATAPLSTLWASLSAANGRALVITTLGDGSLAGVLGTYTDKDGARRVVLQQRQDTLDVPLSRYVVDAERTYVLRG